jgi:hypothetical protein
MKYKYETELEIGDKLKNTKDGLTYEIKNIEYTFNELNKKIVDKVHFFGFIVSRKLLYFFFKTFEQNSNTKMFQLYNKE